MKTNVGLNRLLDPCASVIATVIGKYIAETVLDGWRKYHSRNRPRIRGVRYKHGMPFYKQTPYERWGFGK